MITIAALSTFVVAVALFAPKSWFDGKRLSYDVFTLGLAPAEVYDDMIPFYWFSFFTSSGRHDSDAGKVIVLIMAVCVVLMLTIGVTSWICYLLGCLSGLVRS